jgi:large subunit ribosomal protein L3
MVYLIKGTPLYAAHFKVGQNLKIRGKTRGLGTCGVMKRWGFSGMPATHGCSLSHRHPGAIGTRGQGKVWKGKKMAGRKGFTYKTTLFNKVYLNASYYLGC